MRALESGDYEAVKNHAGKTMRAYAMTDQMEYFAESTEAFFGQNDFGFDVYADGFSTFLATNYDHCGG